MALDILIVDDNREAAELFQELLELEHHRVRCAYTAEQALALAREQAASVYMLDLTLPDMHGTELGRQLRALALPAKPMVVAVTGLASSGTEGAEVFDHFLQKPVDFARLSAILANADRPGAAS